MARWKLKRTEQCEKCPWIKGANPRSIPNGYSEGKHRALESTIADPAGLEFLNQKQLRVMACHEDHDCYCVGWLMQQIGNGNNIGLRIKMLTCCNFKEVVLHGDQHQQFSETLPT